jgi:hypothetical protein
MSEGMSNAIVKRSDKAFFTFGRYQPPTIGHFSLIAQMLTQGEAHGADTYVFASSKHEPGSIASRWPLNVGTKYEIFKKRYPDSATIGVITTAPTAFAAVDLLKAAGYTDITAFFGSDQVYPSAENPRPLGQALSKAKAGEIPVKVVAVIRDQAMGNTPVGMSGTKMRQAAAASNLPRFAAGLNMSPNNAIPYMSTLRTSMGLPAGGTRSLRHTKQKKRRQTRRR